MSIGRPIGHDFMREMRNFPGIKIAPLDPGGRIYIYTLQV
jgi:hypothetical protein